LVRGNSFHGNNRSIDSINNSLVDDHKYNVKKRWLHDNKEFSGVGKTILGISEQNRFEQPNFSNSNYMGDTNFSHASTNRAVSTVAYSVDGKAFGVVPKEIIDQLVDSENDWNVKSMAIESIYEILSEISSMKAIVSYAPSFLKFLCRILNSENNSKIVSTTLKIINKVLSIEEVPYKVNDQTIVSYLIK